MPHTLNPNIPLLHDINIKILLELLEFKTADGKPKVDNTTAVAGCFCYCSRNAADHIQP